MSFLVLIEKITSSVNEKYSMIVLIPFEIKKEYNICGNW
jgi:hypothetical protein